MFYHGPLRSYLLSRRKPMASIQNAHCRFQYVHETVRLHVTCVFSWSTGGALQQDGINTQVTRNRHYLPLFIWEVSLRAMLYFFGNTLFTLTQLHTLIHTTGPVGALQWW